MRKSGHTIVCADILIKEYKDSGRKALPWILGIALVVFLVFYIADKPKAMFPAVVASVMIGVGYVISRQHSAIAKIKCPECGSGLSMHSSECGVMLLACRKERILFRTDCMHRYQGSAPEKVR